jgi:predicted dehydrogenase
MKYGVVGCGQIGTAHARAALKDARVDGLVLYDPIPEAAQKLQAECGGAIVRDLDAMKGAVGAVSVTAPPAEHYALARRFLEAGIPVFCEKPLAMVEREAAELVHMSRERRAALIVGFKMRFEPVFKRARDVLPSIGRLLSFATTKSQPVTKNPAKLSWLAGVGAMYELSVHEMDLVGYLTGRTPVRVAGSQLSFRFGWAREDGFALLCDYSDGLAGTMICNYADEIAFLYRDLCMTFVGEKGYVRIERPDRIIVHLKDYQVIEVPTGGDAFADEVGVFLDHVQSKGRGGQAILSADGAEGYAATALVEAAFRAGKRGGSEKIEQLSAFKGGRG